MAAEKSSRAKIEKAKLVKMSFNLSEDDKELLDRLSNDHQTSKTNVMRNALRLYERVYKDTKKGKKFYVENGGSKVELLLI